jgi:hypothetical protein
MLGMTPRLVVMMSMSVDLITDVFLMDENGEGLKKTGMSRSATPLW